MDTTFEETYEPDGAPSRLVMTIVCTRPEANVLRKSFGMNSSMARILADAMDELLDDYDRDTAVSLFGDFYRALNDARSGTWGL